MDSRRSRASVDAVHVHPSAQDASRTLANLYLGRLVFALGWAAVFAATAAGLDVLTGVLLVLYPAVDVAAVLVDAVLAGRGRHSGLSRGARLGLVVNLAVSAAAAVALAFAAADGVPAVLRVWGTWAVVAGLAQLVVAVARRRAHRGQWSLVLSGGLSCVAGTTIALSAGAPNPGLANIAGYAVAGAVFFAVAVVRLRRSRRPGVRRSA